MVANDDVTPLDELTIPGIDEYPPTASVLLHGPPGTGKTTTAAARVAMLIRDYDYPLEQITWATYRRSLADDTLDRLVGWGVVPEWQLDKPTKGSTKHISTFHAIANRLAGDLPQPVQPWHRAAFCNRLGIKYKTEEAWDKSPGKELFSYFDWMKENLLDPGNPDDLYLYPEVARLREQFSGDPANIWDAWVAYKDEQEVIDYFEQLEAVIDRLLIPTRNVLVIDEFHDATPLIARVAELWMDAAEIVIVAGDPHQVVNSYQGASPMFFERLEDRYPKILLDTSWRLDDGHWSSATQVLSNAHTPPPVTPTGDGEIFNYRSPRFEKSGEGKGWISPAPDTPGSPVAIMEGRNCSNDVMFLTRTKVQADGVCAVLERAGVIYRSQNELCGWNTDRGETRHALYNALKKIEGVRPVSFDDTQQGRLRRFGGGMNHGADGNAEDIDTESIFLSSTEAAAILQHTPADYLPGTRGDCDRIITQILGKGTSVTATELAEHVTREFWTVYTHGARSEPKLLKERRSDRERRALRIALEVNDGPVDPGDVGPTVMTIHASKGQEATDVVLYDGISDTVVENVRTRESERKNEWRTWYVGMTRASERLHIVRGAFAWTTPILSTSLGTEARTDKPITEPEAY